MADQQIKIKQEPIEHIDMETRILELCTKIPAGISDDVIQNDIPSSTTKERVMAINRLLSNNKIDLLKSGKKLIYRLKKVNSESNKGIGTQEKLVYQIIEEAGNKGIWVRTIRYKSNLLLTEVNKILKNLESKKFVKAIKSVAESRRKVYMLYDLEPDRSVTGGAWYNDQEFESEFVDILNQQCLKLLQSKLEEVDDKLDLLTQMNTAYCTPDEVTEYIKALGISKVNLEPADIEVILTTLIYDGKAERTCKEVDRGTGGGSHTVNLYRAVKPITETTALMRTPCGVCPVYDECHVGGIVSPANCEYFNDWLAN